MKCDYRGISMVAIVSAMGAIAPCGAADGEDGSVFDRIWSYATP